MAKAKVGDKNRLQQQDRDKLNLRCEIEYYKKGELYRINQAYDPKTMPEMSYELAFNGKHFQIFNRNSRRLNYSVKEQRDAMVLVLPNVLLEPLQFLGGEDNRKPGFNVAWQDLQNIDTVRQRLAQAVLEKKVRDGKLVTWALFPGGKFEGRKFRYRVVLDGPGGKPSRVDRISEKGALITQAQFEYDGAEGDNQRMLVREMRFMAFDDKLNVAMKSVVKVTVMPEAKDIPVKTFTIDFREADIVYDMDAKTTVQGLDAGREKPELKVDSPTTTPTDQK